MRHAYGKTLKTRMPASLSYYALFTCLLAGCFNPEYLQEPTDRNVWKQPALAERTRGIKRTGLIIDVAVLRREGERDGFFSLEESARVSELIRLSATEVLKRRGYRIPTTVAPYIGGHLEEGSVYPVASRMGEMVRRASPPLATRPESLPAGVQESLLVVIRAGFSALREGAHRLDVSRAPLQSLQEMGDGQALDSLLLIVANGVIIPLSQQAQERLITGVASLVLSGGMIMVQTWQASFLNTYALLIDIEDGSVLWSNSRTVKGADPTTAEFFDQWRQDVLFHVAPVGFAVTDGDR